MILLFATSLIVIGLYTIFLSGRTFQKLIDIENERELKKIIDQSLLTSQNAVEALNTARQENMLLNDKISKLEHKIEEK